MTTTWTNTSLAMQLRIDLQLYRAQAADGDHIGEAWQAVATSPAGSGRAINRDPQVATEQALDALASAICPAVSSAAGPR